MQGSSAYGYYREPPDAALMASMADRSSAGRLCAPVVTSISVVGSVIIATGWCCCPNGRRHARSRVIVAMVVPVGMDCQPVYTIAVRTWR